MQVLGDSLPSREMRCEISPSFSRVLRPSENQKEAEIQNEQADHANPLRRKQRDVLEDQGIGK